MTIGGNISLNLQVKTTVPDEIGSKVAKWETVQTLPGWLDYSSGETKRNVYNSKIQESTHVFVGDYVALVKGINAEIYRAIVNDEVYDVVFIDNPMELNYQWEIYLKYLGGNNG